VSSYPYPSDACTGVVKSAVTRAVKARQTVMLCPEDMYKYCFENLTKETTQIPVAYII
jgi:hypothetical protein